MTGFDVSVQDASGKIVTWNEGAERLVCYSEPEIVGRSSDLIFTPEDRNWGAPERERLNAYGPAGAKTKDGTSERMASVFGDPVSFTRHSARRSRHHLRSERVYPVADRLMHRHTPFVFASGDGNVFERPTSRFRTFGRNACKALSSLTIGQRVVAVPGLAFLTEADLADGFRFARRLIS